MTPALHPHILLPLCGEKLSAAPAFRPGYLNPGTVPQSRGSTPNQGPAPQTADDEDDRNFFFSNVIVFILLTVLLVQPSCHGISLIFTSSCDDSTWFEPVWATPCWSRCPASNEDIAWRHCLTMDLCPEFQGWKMGFAEVTSHRFLLFRSEFKLGLCTVPMPLRLFFCHLSRQWVPWNEHWMLHLLYLKPPPTLPTPPRSCLSGWTCLVRLPDLTKLRDAFFTFDCFLPKWVTLPWYCCPSRLMRNCLILWRRGKGRKKGTAFSLVKATGTQGGSHSEAAGKVRSHGCHGCWPTGWQSVLWGSGAVLDTVFEGDESLGDCLELCKLVGLWVSHHCYHPKLFQLSSWKVLVSEKPVEQK